MNKTITYLQMKEITHAIKWININWKHISILLKNGKIEDSKMVKVLKSVHKNQIDFNIENLDYLVCIKIQLSEKLDKSLEIIHEAYQVESGDDDDWDEELED